MQPQWAITCSKEHPDIHKLTHSNHLFSIVEYLYILWLFSSSRVIKLVLSKTQSFSFTLAKRQKRPLSEQQHFFFSEMRCVQKKEMKPSVYEAADSVQ